MNRAIDQIEFRCAADLAMLAPDSRDAIVISTRFSPAARRCASPPRDLRLSKSSVLLLREAGRALRFGGLLFVYGAPRELALWGQHLDSLRDDAMQMVFKYWIALDLDDAPRGATLKPTHLGLLLFYKEKPVGRTPVKYSLNTKSVRVPHAYCAACNLNVKDWGGKKHLMNPQGTALSDVWRDLPRMAIRDSVVPEPVMNRIRKLSQREGRSCLHIVQHSSGVVARSVSERSTPLADARGCELDAIEHDKVYQADCVAFLNRVAELHPDGLFDLAFADPPYNLDKSYDAYEDALADQHYLEWCNQWLDGMARTLKPGGSLLVLNLPKWAMHHAAFLNARLEFRHWIAWDALSDPRGKLMPAHYALLYYTKPGGKPVFRYANREGVQQPDAPKYCLRAKCIKDRKARGDADKVELADVWFDIHRIRHKRDRDAHPCQLPEKLMERIIKLTTNPGGLVFDPFCGAGTTAIAATKLGRHYVTVDTDPKYVRITTEKLAEMRKHADLFGELVVPRVSVVRPKRTASKKAIEQYLQSFAARLGRVPTEAEVAAAHPTLLQQIDAIYPTRSAAFKRSKLALQAGAGAVATTN
jgi:site-specific DNA-methyltransferase (adenine-specific)